MTHPYDVCGALYDVMQAATGCRKHTFAVLERRADLIIKRIRSAAGCLQRRQHARHEYKTVAVNALRIMSSGSWHVWRENDFHC